MRAIASVLHILVQVLFVLLLLFAEGKLWNHADSALATAMIVQNLYPLGVAPVAAATSLYLVFSTASKNSIACLVALASFGLSVIAVPCALVVDLGYAWKLMVLVSMASIACMVVVISSFANSGRRESIRGHHEP